MALNDSSSERPKISACIISFNEEDRIEECVASVGFCDEVLVVDSHSQDATRELASAAGARVIERDWPGFGPQKEFTIRAAEHDWVLCLDSDERISDELREEIVSLRDSGFPEKAGWRMPRMSNYLGRWIKHGVWYPDHNLRLFDRRRGCWGGHRPHEHVELDGPAGTLNGNLLHHPYRSFAEHVKTIDDYTTIMAKGMHERGRNASTLNVIINPFVRFVKSYILKRGFLDGWRGLVIAYQAAYYVRLKYIKLLILQQVGSSRD